MDFYVRLYLIHTANIVIQFTSHFFIIPGELVDDNINLLQLIYLLYYILETLSLTADILDMFNQVTKNKFHIDTHNIREQFY